MEFKDCPNCGTERIRSTVRVCGECEVTERYEASIAAAYTRIRELEAAGARLIEKVCDGSCKIKDIAKALKVFGDDVSL